jgi:hypothetical protein
MLVSGASVKIWYVRTPQANEYHCTLGARKVFSKSQVAKHKPINTEWEEESGLRAILFSVPSAQSASSRGVVVLYGYADALTWEIF